MGVPRCTFGGALTRCGTPLAIWALGVHPQHICLLSRTKLGIDSTCSGQEVRKCVFVLGVPVFGKKGAAKIQMMFPARCGRVMGIWGHGRVPLYMGITAHPNLSIDSTYSGQEVRYHFILAAQQGCCGGAQNLKKLRSARLTSPRWPTGIWGLCTLLQHVTLDWSPKIVVGSTYCRSYSIFNFNLRGQV